MPQSGLRERCDTALDRFRVDVHLCTFAAGVDTVGAELLGRQTGELERVERLQARLVTAAFDPRRRTELVQ